LVDRSYLVNKQIDIKYFGWMEVDVELSQNDTVTFDEFSATENLRVAALVRKSDALELTCSIANNQVICTNAGVNMQCVLFLVGVKVV
jgi:hypothetical protein